MLGFRDAAAMRRHSIATAAGLVPSAGRLRYVSGHDQNQKHPVTDARDVFLPNFCSIRSVFAVVVVGELLVFVMVLIRGDASDPWQALSLLSLFVQWIALGSTAALCLLRPWLQRLSAAAAATLSYGVILGITAVVSEAGYRVVNGPDAVGHGGFVLRSLLVAAIVAAVLLRYLYLQHEWRQRLQAATEARIDALQARIRPHFLFNSLNTIASMIATAPEEAERMVEDLADLFRASLSRSDRMTPLRDELALVDGYLRMEQLRMGERLRVHWDAASVPRDALIPPLTLQPLLENAVYYGIEPRRGGGTVSIRGRVIDSGLEVEVENPTPGTAPRRSSGFGMAQANVRERLQLAFGRQGRLEVSEREGVYHVIVRFPYRRGTSDEDSHR
jgi:two-component system sensor histidine kinase AlgZ